MLRIITQRGISINNKISSYNILKREVIISRNLSNYSGFAIFRYGNLFQEEYYNEQLIQEGLKKNFYMKALNSKTTLEIIKNMSLASIEKDETVFEQGMDGNYFYIIKEGEVKLYIDDT